MPAPITVDPKAKNYFADAKDLGPAYSSGTNMGGYTKNGLIMVDKPTAARIVGPRLRQQLEKGSGSADLKAVKVVLHFQTYLVYKTNAIYRLDWDNSYFSVLAFRPGQDPDYFNTDVYRVTGGAGKDVQLSDGEEKIIKERFPDQAIVKVD